MLRAAHTAPTHFIAELKRSAIMKQIAIALTVAAVAGMVLLEIIRSIVHAHRIKSNKTAGTQDIAMVGTFVLLLLVISSVICWIGWFLTK